MVGSDAFPIYPILKSFRSLGRDIPIVFLGVGVQRDGNKIVKPSAPVHLSSAPSGNGILGRPSKKIPEMSHEKNKNLLHPGRFNGWNIQPSPMNGKENDSEPNLHEDMFHVNLPGCTFHEILVG